MKMNNSIIPDNSTTCNAILQSGVRKGQLCNRACSDSGRCGYHKLKVTTVSPSSIKQPKPPIIKACVHYQSIDKIVLLQKIVRGTIIRIRYMKCQNDVSSFSHEEVTNLCVPIRYCVNKLTIVEDFKGLYEWYCVKDGFTKQYTCLHTQMCLYDDQNNNLRQSFARILYNISYMVKTKINIKSRKTLSDKLYDSCAVLDGESHNVIFTGIFRCMPLNMILTLVTEIKYHLLNGYGVNTVIYSRKKFDSINTRPFTYADIISLFENGDIKLKTGESFDGNIEHRDKIIRETRDLYLKLYIAEQLEIMCNTQNDPNISILDVIKDTHIWAFVATSYLVPNTDITEINCIDKLLNHPSICTYDTDRMLG